jgi:hypothetical protein
MRLEGLGKFINSNFPIEFRTHDFLACSILPHSLHYRVPPPTHCIPIYFRRMAIRLYGTHSSVSIFQEVHCVHVLLM